VIPVLFAIGLPAAAGALACRALWPAAGRPGAAGVILLAGLGTGFGLGVSSLVYFAALLAGGSPGGGYAYAEGTGFALLALVLAARARRAPRAGAGPAAPPPGGPRPMVRLAAVAGAVALASFLAAYPVYHRMIPHGINDSIMFWNLRARFLFRGGDHWRDGFGPMYVAPEYPLLLPCTVARCWTYEGGESTEAPALVALAFALATLATLAAGLAALRGVLPGLLAGLLLLGTTYYFETAAMLVADVPIGFYYTASLVLLAFRDRAGAGWGLAALAGAAAGLAAWTKNDGQLFVVVVPVVRAVWALAAGRWRFYAAELGAFLAGLAPALIALAVFKLDIAPASPFVTGQGGQATLARLQNVGRYLLIGQTFAENLWTIGPGLIPLLIVYGLLLGAAPGGRRPGGGPFAAVTGLMLAGYFAVYLVTPYDLRWQLETSFDRLRMQLWPTALFAFFLWAATPAEATARRPRAPAAPPPPPPPVQRAGPPSASVGLPRYRGGAD